MKSISYKTTPLTADLNKKARLLELAGDPTRIRILCFMFRYEKACVSDVARSLKMTVASISHHLQVMKDNEFFTTERIGNNICYILNKNKFTSSLKEIICKVKLK